MTDISVNKTYISAATTPYPIESIHRVLWFNEDDNIAVLIRIDKKPLLAPHITNYIKLCSWIDERKLLPKTIPPVPQQRLTDEKLTERYPAKNRKADPETNKRPEVSAPVEYRNKWLSVIDDITPHLESVWRKKKSLYSVISIAAKKHSVPENETYQVLYRFLASGCARQSVISDRFLCGGKNDTRVGKGFNLGRLKTATKLNGLPNDNFPLDALWIQNIQDTYRETIKRGVSASSAYQTFLNLYCTISCSFINEKLDVEYLPIDRRPSKVQFIDHGSGDDPAEKIWRKQLVGKEFEKNFKGLYGAAEPETFRTGVSADVDSTSNDRYLVSVFNRLKGVGTAKSLPVVDVSTGYIFGFYVGWRVNSEAAKLAILNAASSKIEFCAKYGIHIKQEEWYSCLHAGFRADKGEFNAEVPRESLGNLNRSIEYVATGHPELRGGGEQAHRRLHDHDANGSTYGKFRARGEKDHAKAADQNIFNYTRELIRRTIWHNNYAPVPHLLTTEMRQMGVKPTRRAILEWSMLNGYHHQIAYHEDDLVLALCPEINAVVTENGVFPIVKRNGDSGDQIILHELRYLGPFLKEYRWLEIARKNERWRIKIRMNPNDPTKVWYQDPDTGLHALTLATKDPLLGRIATVHDLIITRTAEIGPLSIVKDEADIAGAKMKLENSAERRVIAAEKREQQKQAKKANQNSSTGADRRKNQQDEVAATGQAPIPIIDSSPPLPLVMPQKPPPLTVVDNNNNDTSKAIEQWLDGDTQ